MAQHARAEQTGRMLQHWLAKLAVCMVCDLPSDGAALCRECADTLPGVERPCPRCARPRAHDNCGPCLLETPEWDDAVCAFAYTFPIDELLRAAKFGRRLVALSALAEATAKRIHGDALARADAVVPIPLHWRRHATRGFNQALELARPLADRHALPLWHDVLVRRRATRPQSRRDAHERRRNLADAFVATRAVNGANVVLFDDVLTTGATLNAAALALRDAGAGHIRVAACARAVLPNGRHEKGRPSQGRPALLRWIAGDQAFGSRMR